MELPPKITNDHDIVAQIADLTDVYNSLVDYLESQKEVVGCGFGCRGDDVAVRCKVHNQEEPKEKCICKYTSGHHTKCPAWVDEGVMKKYVPQEPKQIDVEGLLEEWSYNERVDLSPLTLPETRNAVYKRNKEIIKIFKQALQQ